MSKDEKDYYKILEVSESATAEEIKKSYRRLSLKYHPDKNVGNPDVVELFQNISGAFEVLGDVEKRQEYDGNKSNPFANMGMPMEMNELFAHLFGGGGHGININGMNMGMNMGQGFHGFPGANVHVFQNGIRINPPMKKPTPIIMNVSVTMENVLNGSTIPVEIERWIIENNLKVFEKQTVYVMVPKGVDDNEIIVLENQGNILSELCKGDIKLFIKVENNTNFSRNGLDLILDKTISLKEALCGFSFEMKYINDKVYTIHNQTGQNIIPPGYKKVIPNMGLTRDSFVGNLIISFTVLFPEKITEEQIQKLNEIL
jgi:DnaJ-class molecular chaperone